MANPPSRKVAKLANKQPLRSQCEYQSGQFSDSADPFGNWDLRREPAKHNAQPAESKDFDNVKKTEFDIFESQPTQSQDDGGDDQPPFFKRRRQ
jgi:cell division protein FtsZ